MTAAICANWRVQILLIQKHKVSSIKCSVYYKYKIYRRGCGTSASAVPYGMIDLLRVWMSSRQTFREGQAPPLQETLQWNCRGVPWCSRGRALDNEQRRLRKWSAQSKIGYGIWTRVSAQSFEELYTKSQIHTTAQSRALAILLTPRFLISHSSFLIIIAVPSCRTQDYVLQYILMK